MDIKTDQAFERLENEIRRLPRHQVRQNLETEFCWLWQESRRRHANDEEAGLIGQYRALRAQVTAVRFSLAEAEVDRLYRRLLKIGGARDWNRRPEAARLNKWLKGNGQGWPTVEACFSEATSIVEALEAAIERASQPLVAPYYHVTRSPGKTARGRAKSARTVRNKAERAARNRAHPKGPSGRK